uniref:ATP-dependent DNA helicase n=1 Tax=Lactuca sativa TaxID=4236 RepID=A0A9R1UYN6_LACSA|nr:hypothetical protein LSAT_V11C700364580 [Lactuca sativa]
MYHIRPNYGVMYSFTFNHKHEIYFGCITKIWMRQKHLMNVVVHSIGDHIHSIVSIIYLSFENHLDDQSYFQDKAILVPTNEEFDATNDYILGLMKD